MKKQGRRLIVAEILLLVISFVFLLGLMSLFKGCPPKEDGSFMSCHWAENMLKGFAALLCILSLLHLALWEEGVKVGLDLGMILASLLALLVPGRLISLCMMEDMRCHLYMKPFSLVTCILLLLLAGADLAWHLLRRK